MSDDKFPGFPSPKENWSKLPHQLIEALPDFSSLAELKVVLYILRHTWGFQEFDDLKRITLDEFQHGRKRKDRSRLDGGVGMSKDAIREGIKRAVEHGFIIVAEDPRPRPGRPAHQYQLKVLEVSTLESSKDQKSVLQVLEVSPSSEKDTIERNPKREKDTLLSSNKKPLADPLMQDLERQTLAKRAEAGGNYATPDNDVLVDTAITSLCQGNSPRKGSGTWRDMANIIKPIHADWGLHDEEVGKALAIIRAAIALFLEEKQQMAVYKYPSFAANYGQYLSRAMNGDTGKQGPRNDPGKFDRARAMTLERLEQHGNQ